MNGKQSGKLPNLYLLKVNKSNSKRYNMRNAVLFYLVLKLLPLWKTFSQVSRTTTVVKVEQGGEKYRNSGNFQDNDTQKGYNINC